MCDNGNRKTSVKRNPAGAGDGPVRGSRATFAHPRSHPAAAVVAFITLVLASTPASRGDDWCGSVNPDCLRDPSWSLPYFHKCINNGPDKVPLILVHGLNSEGYDHDNARWRTLLDFIAENPSRFARFNVWIWYHDTSLPIGFNCALGSNARQLHDGILNCPELAEKPVLFVAHSRGGLVCRSFMNYENNASRTIGLVTLGTPHHGSPGAVPDWAARFFSSLDPLFLVFFDVLYYTNGWALDPNLPGSVQLAWDNADGRIGDLAAFYYPAFIASGGYMQLTRRDTNAGVGTQPADVTVFYKQWWKDTWATLAWLNDHEPNSVRARIIPYGAYQRDLFDGYSLGLDLANLLLLFRGPNDHGQLAYAAFLHAQLSGIVSAGNYYANDGFVPLQSALYLNLAGNPQFSTLNNSTYAVTIDPNVIQQNAQWCPHYHITWPSITDHLGLLDADIDACYYYWDWIAEDVNGLLDSWDWELPVVSDLLISGDDPNIVSGHVSLQVTATDDLAVAAVGFAYSTDGTSWSDPPISGSYWGNNWWTAMWDTTPVQYNPTVWVRAIARDAVGHESAPVMLNVGVDNRSLAIQVVPGSLDFGDVLVGANVSRALTVTAGGGTDPTTWQISTDPNWIIYSGAPSGSLQPGHTLQKTVTVMTANLSVDEPHYGQVFLTSTQGNVTVPVSVYVMSYVQDQNTVQCTQDLYARQSTQQVLGHSFTVIVGREPDGSYAWTMVRFPLPAAMQNQYIIGARLDVYCSQVTSASPMRAALSRVVGPWTEDSSYADLLALDYVGLFDTAIFISGAGQWYYFGIDGAEELRQVVQDWADDPEANYGLAISVLSGDPGVAKTFHTRENQWLPLGHPILTVGYAPFEDNDPPLLAVASHFNNQRVTASPITLTGTAYDPSGVQWVRVNGSDAQGTTNWTKTRNLQPGANVLTITAQDLSYNSAVATLPLTIYYDVPDFGLSVSPAALQVLPNGTAAATVLLESLAGFSSAVTLGIAGLPSGLSGQFVLNPVTPTGSSQFVVQAGGSVVPGSYAVTITASGGGKYHEQPVTILVAADCNQNGISDSEDIAHGAAGDCNGNGVPDQCDLASGQSGDCNGNGYPDECELAGNDCNGNGVLDQCELTYAVVYVNWANTGCENGTQAYPFNTVTEAYDRAASDAVVYIQAGTYPETGHFAKPMRLQAQGGLVRIGAP